MSRKRKRKLDKLDKIELFISTLLKFFLLGLFITSIIKAEFFLAFSSAFVLFLTFVPSIIDRNIKINLPTEFDFVTTVILWLHFVLGEVNSFYRAFWWWDIFLHYASSMILGLMGFIIAYIFFFTQKVKANPWVFSLFAVTFAISLGTVWEIFEFGMDSFFGFNMQKSGLVDTMWDLIFDTFGAIVISAIGYFYVKNPRKGLFDRIIGKTLHSHRKDK
ncbi:hypothetical protein GOV08_00530 [Candidatus Woesearchaeota archaeon]|nr:hypothetical protein [Candidatus Woesearchaeota archaeon]